MPRSTMTSLFNPKAAVALAACLCAALLAAVALPARVSPEPLFPGPSAGVAPYTVEQRQTYAPADGQPFLRAVKERRQSTNGTFVVAHTYYRPDGTIEAEEFGVGHVGVGSFRVDERRRVLEFVGGVSDADAPSTEAELSAEPDFERFEDVMGQRTVVTRAPKEPDAASYREVYRAPSLGFFELKAVTVTPNGTEVLEPARVDLGEPDLGRLNRVSHYPKSFAAFEERIRAAERKGEPEKAEALRRRLARARN